MSQSNEKPVQSSGRRQVVAVATCLTLLGAPLGAQATATPSAVQPEAVTALRQMGTYLRSLKQFGVDAVTSRDEVTLNGEKVQVSGTVEYLVRTPDRLRADVRTDRKQRQIFYNGKALTVFAPRMLMYASVPAPPTIGTMLDTASERLQIDFPLADLFLWGTAREGVKDLTSARYVGPAYVDGTDTDQYAFRQRGADWQIWIQRGATPLPRRVVITTTSNAAQPQYVATLKWNLVAKFNDSEFTFAPPKGAQRIVFANLQQTQKPLTGLPRAHED
jgi:hypothetical protein